MGVTTGPKPIINGNYLSYIEPPKRTDLKNHSTVNEIILYDFKSLYQRSYCLDSLIHNMRMIFNCPHIYIEIKIRKLNVRC